MKEKQAGRRTEKEVTGSCWYFIIKKNFYTKQKKNRKKEKKNFMVNFNTAIDEYLNWDVGLQLVNI